VLKPTDCSGSTGVRFISTLAQYERGILNNPAYKHDKLIVQRYVPGSDIDLSLLSLGGELSLMAIQQVQGSRIRFLSNAYLEGVATDICRKSGYHGVMHIDARIEAGTGKVFLIECNPRFWASLTATVKCGVNFVEHCVQPALHGRKCSSLLAGIAAMRHPLLQPFCWKVLVSDTSMHGRLLRVELLDLYTFGQLLCQLPMMAVRLARRVGSLPLRRVRGSSLGLAGNPTRR
jgi:ATP-grasp in the biosynthetic pathway with Ter operon